MQNWKDPLVIQAVAEFYSKSLFCVLGLYVWEIIVTFDLEISFLSSETRRPWRWHYASYFVCRYSFLITTILSTIITNTTWPINCQLTYTITQFFGNITMGTASLNLGFRTVAIWRNNRVLSVLLVTLAGGHWFVLLFCVTTLKGAKNNVSSAPPCMVTGFSRPWLVTYYVYTMVFDMFIMVACSLGLWKTKPRDGGLYRLLWADGLLYFVCASVANAIPVVFLSLNLNPTMDVVSTTISACLTAVVSCRAVQRLSACSAGTQEMPYNIDRSGRSDPRKPRSIAGTSIDHGRKPWNQPRYFPAEGDVHLSSTMFAITVCVDNERHDPGNGKEYDGQQKSPNDGGTISLQSDDVSMACSQTMALPWKQTPSRRSGSTSKDKVNGSLPYKPTRTRVAGSSEQPAFPTKPASLHQTSESIEEDERSSRDFTGPSPSTIPSPRVGHRVMEVGPAEMV